MFSDHRMLTLRCRNRYITVMSDDFISKCVTLILSAEYVQYKLKLNQSLSHLKNNLSETCPSFETRDGRFPFTNNFGKFLLGISVWSLPPLRCLPRRLFRLFRLGKRVPFVTSSILGSRGRPGRLIDRERYGTGDCQRVTLARTRGWRGGSIKELCVK